MAIGESFPNVLQAARLGSEWAWRVIYRDLSPAVLRYLRARRAPDPEDLTGDVFLHVVRGLERFQGGEHEFRAWVFTIARHRAIDVVRQLSRRLVEPMPDDFLVANGPNGDVEEDALGALGAEHVREILSELTPQQRDVLLLRVLGGLTVPEVAEALGKRPGAVKALQARALAAIKRKISREAVTL